MANQTETALKVCAAGFDPRSVNLLQMIFKANCQGLGLLVEEAEAEAAIIDLDHYEAAQFLDAFQKRFPPHSIIVMSVSEPKRPLAGMVFVRKPAKIADILDALKKIRAGREAATPPSPPEPVRPPAAEPEPPPSPSVRKPMHGFSAAEARGNTGQAATRLVDQGQLEEVGYHADIGPESVWEAKASRYDPGKYLQGYLESAYRMATSRNAAICLNTGWKPIIIFPQAREVLIEADDEQLRSFCLVPVHSIAALETGGEDSDIMSIVPAGSPRTGPNGPGQYRVQRMEAFLWKVALWTSSGRVPQDVEMARPIYLRHWPNFTRLQMSPNALRIAALLVEQSRSMPEICEILRIPPKDVFAFYSAARAIGLAGQARRQSEGLIAAPQPARTGNTGVLKKILQRLFTGRREAVNG